MAKKRIVPDEQLMMAAQRHATGANVHKVLNLLEVYQLQCWVGDEGAVKATVAKLRILIRAHSDGQF